jgi:fumarate hydratase class II
VAKAIQTAAAEVAAGDWDAQFPIDVYQTGSGTSSNMNANEVIATLANRAGKAGKTAVHPNDHVNQGQSSNDVIPTAMRVSAVLARMSSCCRRWCTCARPSTSGPQPAQGGQDRPHPPDGRDAADLRAGVRRMVGAAGLGAGTHRRQPEARAPLPLGGTAIGTGINADPRFGAQVAKALKQQTGFKFDSAENKFEGLAAQDDAVELSGQLKRWRWR